MVKKHRGQSASFMARIRKLRKRKVNKPISVMNVMARKRHFGGRMRRYGKRTFGKSSLMDLGNIALGTGGFLAYKLFLSPSIPLDNNVKPFVELAAGILLHKQRGILGSVGKAAVYISVYQLMVQYVAPAVMGSSPTTVQGAMAYY